MKTIKELYRIGHGPSSSHTMGPERACQYILNKYQEIKDNSIDVYLFGSLARTGKGHLTDVIIKKVLDKKLHEIIFDTNTIKEHPNTLEFVVNGNKETIYSIGGGELSIDKQNKDIYPFKNFEEIRNYCLTNKLKLEDVVYKFEGNEIKEYLELVFNTMEEAIKRGLNASGTLPGKLNVLRKASSIYNSDIDDNKTKYVSAYAFATSEENASGNVIVTAPTCGSCGVVPSILHYCYKNLNVNKNKIIDALAACSLIGNVIKQNASISGAFAGCQSEIGSACSMGAVAYSTIFNKSLEEIEYAAEIALEHHLGLTCDPINGQVQIPCIERNAVAALRAIDASNLSSLLNGTRKISFDTVVKTMYETGKDLNQEYKETSLAGLAKIYYEK